ncbi:MAG: LuxR family transcriptional regulator [Roseinatronobacter sp.]
MPIHDLSATPDPGKGLLDLLKEACERLELEYAAYAGVNPIDNSVHIVVSYPEAWKEHYQRNDLHLHDPAMLHAQKSQAPITWGRLVDDPLYDKLFSAATAFGIPETGVTIPIRGPSGDKGLLSGTRKMTNQQWNSHLFHILPSMQVEAAIMHDTVMQQGALMRTVSAPTLSHREIEILQWSAAGKTQTDIGDILSISARTVEVHMRSARSKLGAMTTAQAVARAVGLRIIYPM